MDERTQADSKSLNPSQWLGEYGDYLYAYALSRLRNDHAAEEVVQETFVAALRAAEQYSGRGAERAWLLGILKRKIVDYVRRRHRGKGAEVSAADDSWLEEVFDERGSWKDDLRWFGQAPDTSAEREEFWQAFRQCLEKLPPRQADVFVLRELDEQSSEEICKNLEISTSNLWVLLHRARLGLARCLTRRWRAEGGPL